MRTSESRTDTTQNRELNNAAVEHGLSSLHHLLQVQEPQLHAMGLFLAQNSPGAFLANFGTPATKKAIELSNLGYAALEASKKIAETNPASFRQALDARLLDKECPLLPDARCPPASRRYRTADASCNNRLQALRGASLLPMRRFLPPAYADRVQEVRRSVVGGRDLPSARDVSDEVHRDRNEEMASVTLLLMQWGQFVDHDLISTVKGRGFNGTVPQCCDGSGPLPPHLTHPSCYPIPVSSDDRFFGRFGIGCLEFLRSAPSTRINCDLGYREQLNQATSYLDASHIYGSDVATSDSVRTFRRGKLRYGRTRPSNPPDPPTGDLCRAGALTADCLTPADGRLSEQPGLVALHTIFVRLHNQMADGLSQANRHWSDEKVYQEARRVIVALVQLVTYREFLPIVLGDEVMTLFELQLARKGYFGGYDERIDASVANAFGAAAFRFGHSLVQNSYVRFDEKHRPIFNNVSLHEETSVPENIFSFGSLDRLLIGLCNQPCQRRDEFIASELTRHLFQFPPLPFGLDLAAINIQRGRDHGLPSYTSWRRPCGLAPIASWPDLQRVMPPNVVQKFRRLYAHVDDIDLFTGGLAEKPVRGALVGPTFACIIAQQFHNTRKGDRFWFENGGDEASFTPAQLQQLRHVTLARIVCHTLTEIETLQPFVFLAPDNGENRREACRGEGLFDLEPWVELVDGRGRLAKKRKKAKRRKTSTTTTKKPKYNNNNDRITIKIRNITTNSVALHTKQGYVASMNQYGVNDIPNRPTFDNYYNNDNRRKPTTTDRNDVTYLIGYAPYDRRTTTSSPPLKPYEVNIKIQYYPTKTTTTTTRKPTTRKKTNKLPQTMTQYDNNYPIYYRPTMTTTTQKPHYYETNSYSDDFAIYRPSNTYYEDRPFVTSSKRPYVYRPSDISHIYDAQSSKRPTYYDNYYGDKIVTDNVNDKLGFGSGGKPTKFVKISSVQGQEYVASGGATNIHLHISQREGDLALEEEENVRMVDLEYVPNEDRWLVYNATLREEGLKSPEFRNDADCTDELPKPIF